ncbi:hypothetical protein EUGRSUZ_J01657 [Eucalyptus grandis]|uniref:Uncharacterized protein n=2 Tax=Eucalyptus grandis TaxID=71139 RepID=A0ACC3J6A3_EUCGR|nr:hypothetical protein EUGRSUZ_J01657 [Eucalyptus grandis]
MEDQTWRSGDLESDADKAMMALGKRRFTLTQFQIWSKNIHARSANDVAVSNHRIFSRVTRRCPSSPATAGRSISTRPSSCATARRPPRAAIVIRIGTTRWSSTSQPSCLRTIRAFLFRRAACQRRWQPLDRGSPHLTPGVGRRVQRDRPVQTLSTKER